MFDLLLAHTVSLDIELVNEFALLPTKGTDWSAGYDLYACLVEWGPDHDTGQSVLRGREVSFYDEVNKSYTIRATVAGALFVEKVSEMSLTLHPGHRVLVPVGIKTRMARDTEAQIRPRSGLAAKFGVTVANAPGTVDPDFPDEWRVILINLSDKPFHLSHGDRVAQAVFSVLTSAHVSVVEAGVVGQVTNRAGGFGSTGR